MRDKKRKIKELKVKVIICLFILASIFLTFPFSSKIESLLNLNIQYNINQTSTQNIENSNYYVSYIDVGQGNSTFIKLPDGRTALIDGGNAEYGEKVSNFLKVHDVSTIDYLIASHADADHIGGLNYVLKNFDVKNIYRPFQIAGTGDSVSSFVVHEDEDLGSVFNWLVEKTKNRSKVSIIGTEIYRNFITNIYSETYESEDGEIINSSVTVFFDGLKISGENYEFEFFAPLKRYVDDEEIDLSIKTTKTLGFATEGYGASDSNDNSSIFLFTCYDDTYLFTGDATFEGDNSTKHEELEFISSLTDEEREILSGVKVYILGHHGSKHSSSDKLVELINPHFIVVSSGNRYSHPNEETLQRIKLSVNLEPDYLLRTDTYGTIEFSSINGSIKYSLESFDKNSNNIISYKLMAIIIGVVLIVIVIAVKPKTSSRSKIVDRKIK